MTKPETVLSLYRCDGLDGTRHYTRQRGRIVRVREHDGQGYWSERVLGLCLDHYNELRASAEPRHRPEVTT